MDDNILRIVIIFLAFLAIVIFLFQCFHQSTHDENRSETFRGIYDPDTKLLLIQEDKKLQSEFKYISVEHFNEMIYEIRKIIYNDIVYFSKACNNMDGNIDGVNNPGERRMTLLCYDDTESIENTVITHMCDYIVNHLKTKYGINMNPLLVFSDFRVNFNMSEDLLYPLTDSTLYTEHGVRYFTKTMLENLIDQDLSIKNILYTIILRRGIDVIPDVDDHI
jgi:hypothetical protein